jgi:glycosyltransferase involved in cell wall biosynthesis
MISGKIHTLKRIAARSPLGEIVQARVDQVHWVCHSPSPYNDFLFRALSEGFRVPIQVHFTVATSHQHRWRPQTNTGYTSRVYRPHLGVDWQLIGAVLRNPKSLFVTNCWQDPTSQLVLLCLMAIDRPYIIWNDTPSENGSGRFLKRVLRKRFLRLVFRRALVVMGTGRTALGVLAKMGCPESKLIDFPYVVNLGSFYPRAGMTPARRLRFGSCGRLDPIKGFDITMRALAEVRRSASFDFEYVIAGAGPQESDLLRLARELGLSDRVQLLGWVDPADLPAFYRSLDVFLHPARSEPFGVSVVEAMSSGLPVIASDRTAAAVDRIRDGVNGLIHKSEDQSALSTAIKRVISIGPERREKLGLAARATSEEWPASRNVDILSNLIFEQAPLSAYPATI